MPNKLPTPARSYANFLMISGSAATFLGAALLIFPDHPDAGLAITLMVLGPLDAWSGWIMWRYHNPLGAKVQVIVILIGFGTSGLMAIIYLATNQPAQIVTLIRPTLIQCTFFVWARRSLRAMENEQDKQFSRDPMAAFIDDPRARLINKAQHKH